LILDDICDGGRTFSELAKQLQVQHAGDIYLYVTHGIFSQGLAALKPHFKHVYCYHTMLPTDAIDSSFLTVLGDAQ
jgi:ribose-phosphate pyrophosphokinase